MKTLKLYICDFWTDFIFETSVLYKILGEHYNIIFDSINPELVLYSTFGNEHSKYKCKKIKITGESYLHDNNAEYEIGMDYRYSLINKNYFYLPLYFLKNNNDINKFISDRDKFMCFLVSNEKAYKRVDIFNFINNIRHVDSGGHTLNNIGYIVPKNKTNDFYRDYKFAISYENKQSIGYLTEKIFKSLINGCIPIYWGDPFVTNIINENCFINANKLTNEQILVKVNEIDNNDELYHDMLNTPIMKDNEYMTSLIKNLENFILNIING